MAGGEDSLQTSLVSREEDDNTMGGRVETTITTKIGEHAIGALPRI